MSSSESIAEACAWPADGFVGTGVAAVSTAELPLPSTAMGCCSVSTGMASAVTASMATEMGAVTFMLMVVVCCYRERVCCGACADVGYRGTGCDLSLGLLRWIVMIAVATGRSVIDLQANGRPDEEPDLVEFLNEFDLHAAKNGRGPNERRWGLAGITRGHLNSHKPKRETSAAHKDGKEKERSVGAADFSTSGP